MRGRPSQAPPGRGPRRRTPAAPDGPEPGRPQALGAVEGRVPVPGGDVDHDRRAAGRPDDMETGVRPWPDVAGVYLPRGWAPSCLPCGPVPAAPGQRSRARRKSRPRPLNARPWTRTASPQDRGCRHKDARGDTGSRSAGPVGSSRSAARASAHERLARKPAGKLSTSCRNAASCGQVRARLWHLSSWIRRRQHFGMTVSFGTTVPVRHLGNCRLRSWAKRVVDLSSQSLKGHAFGFAS